MDYEAGELFSVGSAGFGRSSSTRKGIEDEEALKWAAFEKHPTYNRLRRRILTHVQAPSAEIEVEKLRFQDKRAFLERLVCTAGRDNQNFLLRLRQRIDRLLHIINGKKKPLAILDDVSGAIKPGRMTLLLGPPASGKTTLLLALVGKLAKDLKVRFSTSSRLKESAADMFDLAQSSWVWSKYVVGTCCRLTSFADEVQNPMVY